MGNREEILALLDIEAHIVELCCLKDAAGRDFYVYMQIAPSRYEEFKSTLLLGDVVLSGFGEALLVGEGPYPPPEVQREMELRYGVCHDLEERLEQERNS